MGTRQNRNSTTTRHAPLSVSNMAKKNRLQVLFAMQKYE